MQYGKIYLCIEFITLISKSCIKLLLHIFRFSKPSLGVHKQLIKMVKSTEQINIIFHPVTIIQNYEKLEITSASLDTQQLGIVYQL